MTRESIGHEEALERLYDHVGDHVRCALSVRQSTQTGESRSRVRVMKCDGVLRHLADGAMPDESLPSETRELFRSAYKIGDVRIVLPSMIGEVSALPSGIEFAFTDMVSLSIMWGVMEIKGDVT